MEVGDRMKIAEWAKLDHIRLSEEYPHVQSTLGLVCSLDNINWGCPLIGFTPNEETFLKARYKPTNHWSRVIEYPWSLTRAQLEPDMEVADVGGGNNPLQFALAFCCPKGKAVNIDLDLEKLKLASELPVRRLFPNLELVCQDVLISKRQFDRVFCISVLEHMTEPVKAVRHLYDNMLKPKGRLLLTFDVCDSPCADFPIDLTGAQRLLAEFDMEVPSPAGAFAHVFQIDGKPRILRVLMVAIDKE